ncbi:MAG TPA: histidine phosphatase family protein [Longimicrobiales bacterium]|nr:histidine phosphatase family protein [Longimicrobiales bacterium]
MERIYFVRHGESEWNAIHRFQGQWDSDLTPRGREQADRNGRLLAGLGIGALFVSPLDRARQTAEIINAYLDVPALYDGRIMEWDCGDWSGHRREEVIDGWPAQWAARRADLFHYRGPNCENYPDMFDRAAPFVEELLALEAERVAVVSHGMIGKVMTSILLGLDERATLAIYQPNDVIFAVTTGPDPASHHYRAGQGPFVGLTYFE